MTDIPNIVASYKSKGLFTHAFVARGRLADLSPYYVHKDFADAADVFDLASLTKALVTTPLLFRWRDRCGLTFEQSVGEWLGAAPLALDARLKALTVRDLLMHTAGLPAWRNFWICRLDDRTNERDINRDLLLSHEMLTLNRVAESFAKGGASVYSDVGFIILGLLLEAASGQDLDQQFKDLCAADLGLNADGLRLGFPRSNPHFDAFISTGTCLIRGRELRGEVHDENCAALGGVAGHAGLFGTGEAVCSFISSLGRAVVGQRLFAENAHARQLPLQIPANEALLGWRQATTPSSLPFGQGAAMGHMGFTGCAFWLWPEIGEYVTLLTNRVISGRTSPEITAMRHDIFKALAAF